MLAPTPSSATRWRWRTGYNSDILINQTLLSTAEEESHVAFKKHFEEELAMYKSVCIVNLVDQQGRERIIWEAYGEHVLKYNSPDVIYATFDFHEYW